MDEKIASALAKRLAAYSATAGITLAASVPAAQTVPTDANPDALVSDVVYFNLDPELDLRATHNRAETHDFDFDLDGVDDLRLFICYPEYTPYCGDGRGWTYFFRFKLPEGANPLNGVYGYPNSWPDCASRLEEGAVIGPAGPGRAFYTNAVAAMNGYGWVDCAFAGVSGYAGFRFVGGDGQLRYGWMRMGANYGVNRGRVFEYAYEATPETPITAGDTGTTAPAVLLEATVDRTVIPPEGATLTFTVTLTNTTDAPKSLDLWGVARGPGGWLAGVRRLADFTLPASATVTREVPAYVPAGAPTGTGEVQLHVGGFPAVVDSEAFQITKERGTHASGAEEEGLFLAGDERFMEEEAPVEATAGIPSTHGVNSPRPNPTTGRAEIALAVAEAQDVSVAVYDALGRRVALLHEGPMTAGAEHRLAFDGSGLPAGVYVVRAVGERFADTRVLTLMR